MTDTSATDREREQQAVRENLLKGIGILAVAVVVGAIVLGVARAYELETGLPCDARGTWGCAFDSRLYGMVGLLLGGAVTGLTGLLAWMTGRGAPRFLVPVLVIGGVVWVGLWAALLSGVLGI